MQQSWYSNTVEYYGDTWHSMYVSFKVTQWCHWQKKQKRTDAEAKSDNHRKRKSNKKYDSFATYINHHQPEAQDKCILSSHKHNLDNCEEYMKKSIEERSKFLAQKLCYGCYKPISMWHNARTCNDRQICQICKKKHPSSLHGCTPKQKAGDHNSSASDGTEKNVTFKSNCAKSGDVNCSASHSDEIVSMYIAPVKIKYVKKKKLPHIPFWINAAREPLWNDAYIN